MTSSDDSLKGEAPASKLPGEDCPCCKSGGWMRDLPPQAQAIVLEQPELLTYELPAATFLLSVRPVATTDRADTGPPGGLSESERPHAAPVGIVRLLT